MFGADIFQRFCTILLLREESYEQFLHYVAAITFFCMSAKYNVSSQSTFYIALKHLKKSTHFMLTHVYCKATRKIEALLQKTTLYNISLNIATRMNSKL